MPKVPNAYAYRSIRACFKSNILRTQQENYTKISIAPFVLWELTNFAFLEIAFSCKSVLPPPLSARTIFLSPCQSFLWYKF